MQTVQHPTAALPPALQVQQLAPLILQRQASRDDEVQEVLTLLLDHVAVAPGDEPALWALAHTVAHTVALACLGDNHLWQDLQLASRAELSALMRHWFPALVAKNGADMKWKKFIYKQLCEREELFICKAPSCEVCSDRPQCFGPEN